MLSSIEDYIEAGLVHSVHTSVRKSFRGCRRRHNWLYNEMYYPKVTAKPLEFGVAFHKAMETWYDPEFWGVENHALIQGSLAKTEFNRITQEQFHNYQKLNGEPDAEVKADYKERVDLGLRMLDYYTQRVSPVLDVGFTPVGVEIPFEVPLGLWCRCNQCWRRYKASEFFKKDVEEYGDTGKKYWEGLPVTYGGRIDMLAVDDYDRIWIFDWKALSLDSQILTPDGWVKMRDIKVGDFIIGSNGKPTQVIGVYPQGEKEVFDVKTSDGASVEATSDHLWTVERLDTGNQKVMTTNELIHELNKDTPKFVVLPELQPVEFETKSVPLDPYVLGLLLGDGGFTQRSVRFSNSDGLESYLPFFCHQVSKNEFIARGAVGVIKELGLFGHKSVEKFIPFEYRFGDISQRLALLQGLMDTDGYVSKGNAIFSTSSPRLKVDVVEIVQSLGGKALVFNDGVKPGATTESFQISIKLPVGLCPFQAPIPHKLGRWRKGAKTHRRIIKSITKSRITETQCIRVDASDALFVTNDFILTHNTTSRILDEDAESAFLQLDDQIGSYCAALAKLGRPVAGFVYHEQRKATPEPPARLLRTNKGRWYSTAKNANTDYPTFLKHVMEHDPNAVDLGCYDDYLEWLKTDGPKYFQRHQVHKNQHELENTWSDLTEEVKDMIGSPRIYPQPGRFTCNNCAYRVPCTGKNMGEDYTYALETLFVKRTKHYFEEEESRTE